MPGTSLPPDQAATTNRAIARIEHRERLIKADPRAQVWLPQLFSYAGALVDGTESAPWYPEHGLTLYGARVSATTAPSGGDVSIQLRLNGSDIIALPLADGTVTQLTSITGFRIPSDSFITVRVDTSFNAADVSVGFQVSPL